MNDIVFMLLELKLCISCLYDIQHYITCHTVLCFLYKGTPLKSVHVTHLKMKQLKPVFSCCRPVYVKAVGPLYVFDQLATN